MPSIRSQLVDVCKGIGIALVVLCHIFAGEVCRFASGFYMPLFFFLSGLWIERLMRSPFINVFRYIGVRLFVPYCIFMLLGFIVLPIWFGESGWGFSAKDLLFQCVAGHNYVNGPTWFFVALASSLVVARCFFPFLVSRSSGSRFSDFRLLVVIFLSIGVLYMERHVSQHVLESRVPVMAASWPITLPFIFMGFRLRLMIESLEGRHGCEIQIWLLMVLFFCVERETKRTSA